MMKRTGLLTLVMALAVTGCNVPGLLGAATAEKKTTQRGTGGTTLTSLPTTGTGAQDSVVTGVLKLVSNPPESTVDVSVVNGKLVSYAAGAEKVAWKLTLHRGVKEVVVAKLRFGLLLGDGDAADAYRLTQFLPPGGAPGAVPPASNAPTTSGSTSPDSPGSTGSTDGGGTAIGTPGGAPGGGGTGGSIGVPAGVGGAPGGGTSTGTIGGGGTTGGAAPGIGVGVPGNQGGGGVPGFPVPPSTDPSAATGGTDPTGGTSTGGAPGGAAGGPPGGSLSGMPGGSLVPGGIVMPGGVAGPTVVGNGVQVQGLPTPAPTAIPTEAPPAGADGKPVVTANAPGDFNTTLVPADLAWPARLEPNQEYETALPLESGQIRRFVEQNVTNATFARTGKFVFRVRIRLVGVNGQVLADENNVPLELRATVVVQ